MATAVDFAIGLIGAISTLWTLQMAFLVGMATLVIGLHVQAGVLSRRNKLIATICAVAFAIINGVSIALRERELEIISVYVLRHSGPELSAELIKIGLFRRDLGFLDVSVSENLTFGVGVLGFWGGVLALLGLLWSLKSPPTSERTAQERGEGSTGQT